MVPPSVLPYIWTASSVMTQHMLFQISHIPLELCPSLQLCIYLSGPETAFMIIKGETRCDLFILVSYVITGVFSLRYSCLCMHVVLTQTSPLIDHILTFFFHWWFVTIFRNCWNMFVMHSHEIVCLCVEERKQCYPLIIKHRTKSYLGVRDCKSEVRPHLPVFAQTYRIWEIL